MMRDLRAIERGFAVKNGYKLGLIFSLLLCLACFGDELPKESAGKVVVVKFNSKEEAKEFMAWMSGQGEQDMSYWMEVNQPSLDKIPEYDRENLVIDFTK